MSTTDCMSTVARCERASATWTALADRAPAGSWREKVYRYLARDAEREANIAWLEAISPPRSRWDVAVPVREVGARS